MTWVLLLIFYGRGYEVPVPDEVNCREVQQAFWTLAPESFAGCYPLAGD